MEGLVWIVTIIVVVSLIGNLIAIVKSYKTYQRFKHTPYFNEALVGCYVQFQGKVISPRHHQCPISRKEVAFYHFYILGFRKYKRKKPQKGTHEVSTTLYSQTTGLFELLDTHNRKIAVSLDTSPRVDSHAILAIKSDTLPSTTLLEGYPYQQDKLTQSFERYEYTAYTLKQHTLVTVYGRLIHKENRYILTNTYHPTLPFKIEEGDQVSQKILWNTQIKNKILYSVGLLLVLFLIY